MKIIPSSLESYIYVIFKVIFSAIFVFNISYYLIYVVIAMDLNIYKACSRDAYYIFNLFIAYWSKFNWEKCTGTKEDMNTDLPITIWTYKQKSTLSQLQQILKSTTQFFWFNSQNNKINWSV